MSGDDAELTKSLNHLDVKDAQDTYTHASRTHDDGDHPVLSSSFTPGSNAAGSADADRLTEVARIAAGPPPTEQIPDALPSSIHPDFSARTNDDLLLVTDDDVGFYVERSFLLEHSDFFRDFEEMNSDIRHDDNGGKAHTRAVRRDLPGALSNGLRVVLLKVKERRYYPDRYDRERKVFCSQHIGDPGSYEHPRNVCLVPIPLGSNTSWFQYLFAVFEADEKAAKAIAKSTLRWDLTKWCTQPILPVLDKHHAPYAALLREIDRRNPFYKLKNPFSLSSSSAACHDFIKKSQAEFKDERLVECGGEECGCKKSGFCWATVSRAGGKVLRRNLASQYLDHGDDWLWYKIEMSIWNSVGTCYTIECKRGHYTPNQ
ncbi:hypothetical protein I350_05693 [Cryptococcus amylolentus CBS 6273]|uniref:Uncharacterized protein n=1 Tax=Cryptococcus amylolentus CBS 6273 TaxID=1296118 RepID=A0A1E3JSH1_9TREE|nr:hypothetical protein I350_05693 [Cryptococcus amylolentus CBS 6273]